MTRPWDEPALADVQPDQAYPISAPKAPSDSVASQVSERQESPGLEPLRYDISGSRIVSGIAAEKRRPARWPLRHCYVE